MTLSMKAGYCIRCGSALALTMPPGETIQRLCCQSCNYIHYENPKILTTCMLYQGTRLLWMQRALEPDAGCWAIPGGFVELGENLQEAACREVAEETGVSLNPWELSLYGVGSLPLIGQIYITFRAALGEQSFGATAEALQVKLLAVEEVDWTVMAYPAINFHVKRFYGELENNDFGVYLGEVDACKGVRVLETARSLRRQKLIHDFGL